MTNSENKMNNNVYLLRLCVSERRNSLKHFGVFLTTGLLLSVIGSVRCTEPEYEVTTEPYSNEEATDPLYMNCCSEENFVCNNETSPEHMECSGEGHSIVILQPQLHPSDRYQIMKGFENDGKGLLVLDSNQVVANFCIGWVTDKGYERTDKTEGALACLKGASEQDDTPNGLFSFGVLAVALLLSAVFALITLIIYIALPWMQDLQGKIIMSLLLSVCCGYPSLAILQLFTNELSIFACIFTGFMVYYWLFSSFTWLHISSFNIWRTIVLRSENYVLFKDKKLLFIIYSVVGWGLPGIFLIISLTLEVGLEGIPDVIRPRFGESTCFFNSERDKWILFYSPLLILILTNIYYFLSVIFHLAKMHQVQKHLTAQSLAAQSTITNTGLPIVRNGTMARQSQRHKKRIVKSSHKFKLYSKLFFAMGITFVFELISDLYLNHTSNADSVILKSLFSIMDLVNALQGVILFIVLILLRKKVLIDICKKLNIPTNLFHGAQGEHDNENDFEDEDTTDEDDNDERNITGNGITMEERMMYEVQMK